jgi:hypothetical protein
MSQQSEIQFKPSHATQEEFVRNYLLSGLALTPVKAIAEAKIFRLAAVIHTLKNKGMKIRSVRRMSFTGRPYCEYSLDTI